MDELDVVQKMTGPDQIAEGFGIFHDGTITAGLKPGSPHELVVEIEDLAGRISEDFERFTIRLNGLEAARFLPTFHRSR